MREDDAVRARHQRVRELFLEATRLPAAERDEFLARASRDDAALAKQVSELLASDASAEKFMAAPALAAIESLAEGPRRIGPYVVRAKIGEGGMGSVFEAEQENPKRVVAVKVLHPSVTTANTRLRFERETRFLARLHHPGIAQIFEAGEAETDLGRQPYFVMERVDGVPITEYAGRNDIDTPHRLQLFARVCDAVQHAHDRGVIHRDLKPANILVDASGQPKVLDFGIARFATRDEASLTQTLTAADLVLGTVPYLAPEQATGGGRDVDARADVFSLGVVLYELLTGDLPFDVRAKPVAEAIRIVVDRDPTPLGSRFKALRGDVETIIGKAMEKEPSRRYATASALASDVRRHLRSEPIAARPPSALYLARKFARRNRAVVAGTLATVAALAAGGAVALKLAFDERAARELAEANAYLSSVVSAVAALATGDSAAADGYLERAPIRLHGWEWRHLDRQIDQSLATFGSAEIDAVTGLAFSADGTRLFSAWQRGGVRACDVETGEPLDGAVATSGADGGSTWALGRHGETHLSADPAGGRLILRRTETGVIVGEIETETESIVNAAISADSSRVAVRRRDSVLDLFEIAGSAARSAHVFPSSGTWRNDAAFSPDGALLAFGQTDGLVRVVDVATGAERARFKEREPACAVTFSPDGSRLAVGYGEPFPSPDGGCVIYELESGETSREVRIPVTSTHVGQIAFSPDGARLAIGTGAGRIFVCDADTGEVSASFRTRESFMHSVAFSPDGRSIAAGSRRGCTKILLAEPSPDEAEILRDHENFVYACAFSPDGKTIASGGWDNAVRLWDAASATSIAALRGHAAHVKNVAFAPSGSSLLSVAADRTYRLWNPRTGRETARFSEEGADIVDGRFTPDGKLVVIATDHPNRKLVTRDVSTGASGAVAREVGGYVDSIAVSPDGRSLATGWRDGIVRIYELPSLALRDTFAGRRRWINTVSYSSDGRRLALGDIDGTVQVVDATTLEADFVTATHGDTIYAEMFAAQFSPDGSRIAAGGRDGVLRLIDAADGKILAKLAGHADYVYRLAWSPDGARIVTASGDKTLRLWDTVPLRERLRARLGVERARSAAGTLVGALFADLEDADAVVARIDSDAALSPDERAAALRETLRRSASGPAAAAALFGAPAR